MRYLVVALGILRGTVEGHNPAVQGSILGQYREEEVPGQHHEEEGRIVFAEEQECTAGGAVRRHRALPDTTF